MNNATPRYPRHIRCNDTDLELRMMAAGDEAAALAFANALPPHDLLFVQRDIRNPKVVAAWIEGIASGTINSMLAISDDGSIQGCAAIVRDELSWSPHVGELRVVVAASMRRGGLGRLLVQDAFLFALSAGLEKLVARMTPDQVGAIAVFEEMGFRAEALLRDYVRDCDSVTHDLVILSLDVARQHAQREAYGYNEAF
jgi:RimJ/RimL family protein N-acetyltransferase